MAEVSVSGTGVGMAEVSVSVTGVGMAEVSVSVTGVSRCVLLQGVCQMLAGLKSETLYSKLQLKTSFCAYSSATLLILC
ncbi:hypothetical protein EB796_020101 [Bugula neritina]|uniref:Uncharacterized protein n=1 Tax=Bugula neritina TaxID=10212 RepID=A0A7J7J7P8_BUGNE|nr:hypothetical protein EB796_020101 [Bugula neritina]